MSARRHALAYIRCLMFSNSMKTWQKYPSILEINTWTWLHELSRNAGSPVTLGTVPDEELDRLTGYGVDGIWLMGVWQRSPGARELDRQNPDIVARCQEALPDFEREDIVGSPYAIYRYLVEPDLGGIEELDHFRKQLRQRGLRLILDFVPNHLGYDNAWLETFPERFVMGSKDALNHEHDAYFSAYGNIFARGRDRYYVWPDTVQLDYRQPETREAMREMLLEIAKHCDGVRCDMAMLVTHDIFLDIWGGEFDVPGAEFWPMAIHKVKSQYPDFLMIAEVYWGMEYLLQQQGFDYTYDKRLYDRLLDRNIHLVQMHIHSASPDYQSRLVHFLENHDEKRAAACFGEDYSKPAAALTLTLPGLRLIQEGQAEGCTITTPVQSGRRPEENGNPELERFYRRLLTALSEPIFHSGEWRLLQPQAEWLENPTHLNVMGYWWIAGDKRRLVVVNLVETPSQCFLPLNMPEIAGTICLFEDYLTGVSYERDGDTLLERGLYLNLPGYGHHLFKVSLS